MIRKNKKSFDPDLNKQADMPAKQTAVSFFSQTLNWTLPVPLDEQPEMYKAWDFVMASPNGKQIEIEVERLFCWTAMDRFQWNEAHLLSRKFTTKAKLFFQTNAKMNLCWVLPVEQLLTYPIETRSTFYTRGELMRIIPADHLPLFARDESAQWRQIKKGKLTP